MSEFGDLEKLDIDRLIRISQEQTDKVAEMQEKINELRGEAASQDKRVRVVVTAQGGVSELLIDPRAMRMRSVDLAETIKSLIVEATADLRGQMSDLMGEIYGDDANPMKLAENQELMQQKIREAGERYQRTLNDATTELERIAKDLDL